MITVGGAGVGGGMWIGGVWWVLDGSLVNECGVGRFGAVRLTRVRVTSGLPVGVNRLEPDGVCLQIHVHVMLG